GRAHHDHADGASQTKVGVNRGERETNVSKKSPKKNKLKTHKGAKNRFKITGTGKIMRAKGMKSHNRRKKAPRVKRQFDRMLVMDDSNVKQVKRLLPNGV